MRGAARRGALRAWVGVSVGSAGLAGCTLGIVDLDPDPSPARMVVASQVVPNPSHRGQVLVTVNAQLDPGIGPARAPRGLVSDALAVDGAVVAVSMTDAAGRSSWQSLATYDAPGPIAVELGFPRIAELPPPTTINMRVQIPVPPDDTLVVAEGEDLVILADAPDGPFENLEAMEWQLELRASAPSTFLAVTGGRGGWPREMRIPAAQLVGGTFPLQARFQLRWRRSLVLFELTPVDRLELTLESDMQTEWTVVRPGPTT